MINNLDNNESIQQWSENTTQELDLFNLTIHGSHYTVYKNSSYRLKNQAFDLYWPCTKK